LAILKSNQGSASPNVRSFNGSTLPPTKVCQLDINHNFLNGCRIGEASHPGPPKPGSAKGKAAAAAAPAPLSAKKQPGWSTQSFTAPRVAAPAKKLVDKTPEVIVEFANLISVSSVNTPLTVGNLRLHQLPTTRDEIAPGHNLFPYVSAGGGFLHEYELLNHKGEQLAFVSLYHQNVVSTVCGSVARVFSVPDFNRRVSGLSRNINRATLAASLNAIHKQMPILPPSVHLQAAKVDDGSIAGALADLMSVLHPVPQAELPGVDRHVVPREVVDLEAPVEPEEALGLIWT